jgi:O-methyltransferase involved in polyketide biosynthesis
VLSGARAQVSCRSRYTEDRLSDLIDGGITQYVILGAGLDSFAYRSGLASPALVSWLGVSMYLTRAAIGRTLGEVGGFVAGTELIVDYMLPAGLRDAAGDTYVELVNPAAASRGEPWLTFVAPGEKSALLTSHGLKPAAHGRQRDAVDAALWNRSDSLRPIELSNLARAIVSGR